MQHLRNTVYGLIVTMAIVAVLTTVGTAAPANAAFESPLPTPPAPQISVVVVTPVTTTVVLTWTSATTLTSIIPEEVAAGSTVLFDLNFGVDKNGGSKDWDCSSPDGSASYGMGGWSVTPGYEHGYLECTPKYPWRITMGKLSETLWESWDGWIGYGPPRMSHIVAISGWRWGLGEFKYETSPQGVRTRSFNADAKFNTDTPNRIRFEMDKSSATVLGVLRRARLICTGNGCTAPTPPPYCSPVGTLCVKIYLPLIAKQG